MKFSDLDPLLSTPSRLAVAATLADGARWSFTALKKATGLADGNLHVQSRRLEAAGYVTRGSARNGNRRVTCFALTPAGRHALQRHIRQLQEALEATDRDAGEDGRPRRGELGRRPDPSRVW